MLRKLTLLAVLTASLPFGGAPAVAQQDPAAPPPGRDVTLEITGEQRPRLRLALPPFEVRGTLLGEARTAANELERTLFEDLQRTGIFDIQTGEDFSVLTLTGDPAKDFELYRSLGNEVILLGEIFVEDGRLVLEGRLYDLASQQSILGKRYRGGFDLARRIAHTFADEIVLYFTGRKGIALTSIAFTSDRSGNKEIYVMDADGRNVRPLTGHKSISMSPAWSSTGDAVAYVSFFSGAPAIYLVDLATGGKRPVVTDGSYNGSPSFSPDGTQIVFSRSLDGNSEIFVANRDGSGLKRLTTSPGIDTNPAWSPTGGQIAFTSSRAGNPHIYVMDVEGTNLRRVTFEGNYNDGAAWSPDGSRIAYATRRRGEFDIAVTDLAVLDTRVLTRGPGSHESPSYSPDGRWIVFTSAQGGRTQIRLMPADGGPSELLTAEGNNSAPDWSPWPVP